MSEVPLYLLQGLGLLYVPRFLHIVRFCLQFQESAP